MSIHLTDLSNWMSFIEDRCYISELSIPGTHQTMTYESSSSNWMKTQSKTLEEQFSMGIRFFDIHLTYLESIGHSGNLVLTQGNSYLKSFFTDILKICQNLLINHPTECILMSVKREHEILSDKFNPLLTNYINENKNFWYLEKTIPTLKEARGKILLIKRFADSNYGIDLSVWKSNSHFSHLNQDGVSYDVQDKYKGFDRGNEEKKYDDNVYPQLIRAIHDDDLKKLYINFANGMEPIWPSTLSGVTNPKLFNFLKSAEMGRYGIIPLDYPENVKFLPLSIIKTNHFKKLHSGHIYTISPKHITHLALEINKANNKYGFELVVNRLDDKPNQAWKLLDAKEGYFYLVSLLKESDVLTVIKTDNEDLSLTLWDNKQKDNQKWKLDLLKEGFYTISPKAYPHLVLEVKDKKTMPNSLVLLSPFSNHTDNKVFNQRWVIMLAN